MVPEQNNSRRFCAIRKWSPTRREGFGDSRLLGCREVTSELHRAKIQELKKNK